MEHHPTLTLEVVAGIAALLGCTPRQAPYRAAGAPVFELQIRSASLGVPVSLLLWTGLARADVRLGNSSMVFKQIDQIELYPGVEVLFRRFDPPGYLFLSTDGRASMVL
ncbi:MAG TPA: hypothetical protein VH916_08125 [Dehalococcoidia bacterium]